MGVKTATGPVPEGSRRGVSVRWGRPGSPPDRKALRSRPGGSMLDLRGDRDPARTARAGPGRTRRGGSWPMRLAERHPEAAETHYTEGELDLEPPEELAIGELDDEAILEEELDNEDLLEQDVEEDTLEASLEDLVHGDDDEDEDE